MTFDDFMNAAIVVSVLFLIVIFIQGNTSRRI